jgi:hypothetical protein
MKRYCTAPGCTNELPEGVRADATCCSPVCRKRFERAKVKGTLSVTARGYMGVTDNPNAAPLPPSAIGLSRAKLDAKFPIPDDLTIPKWLRRDPDAAHWKLLDE